MERYARKSVTESPQSSTRYSRYTYSIQFNLCNNNYLYAILLWQKTKEWCSIDNSINNHETHFYLNDINQRNSYIKPIENPKNVHKGQLYPLKWTVCCPKGLFTHIPWKQSWCFNFHQCCSKINNIGQVLEAIHHYGSINGVTFHTVIE